jgi:uncharacterized membrane protein
MFGRRVATARLRFSSPGFLLTIACVTALGLRLIVLRGLWVDEAITVANARLPFAEMLDHMRATDIHPPLHYASVLVAMRLLGASEFSVRLPSILAGVLLVPAVFVLARELFDRGTGLIAAGLAAVSPLLVWYSQEARMYALLMLFSVVAIWTQVVAVKRGCRWAWVLYAMSTAAMIWTQYFAIFQVAVQQLAFAAMLWSRWRDNRSIRPLLVGWVSAGILIALAIAPLVPFAVDQYEANRARYASPQVPSNVGRAVSSTKNDMNVYTLIANSVWALVGYHSDRTMSQIVAMWPLGISVALLLLGRGRPSRSTMFVLACAFVPILGMFAAGFQERTVFEVRYFATAVPLLIVLCARLVRTCATRPLVTRGATALMLALLLTAGIDQQINGTNPRIFDFRGALQELSERSSPGDLVVYQPQFLDTVVDYYVEEIGSRPLSAGIPKISPGERIFFVGSFLDDPRISGRAGGALAGLEERYRLLDRFERPQVRVWVFIRPEKKHASHRTEAIE